MNRVRDNLAILAMLFLALTTCAGKAHAAEPPRAFSDLPEAVRSALDAADVLAPTTEAGGTLYNCLGLFTYLAPVTQDRKRGVQVVIYGSTECKLVGLYHTHPAGDSRFSAADMANACDLEVPSFMRPHGRRVVVFTCPGVPLRALSQQSREHLATGVRL